MGNLQRTDKMQQQKICAWKARQKTDSEFFAVFDLRTQQKGSIEKSMINTPNMENLH